MAGGRAPLSSTPRERGLKDGSCSSIINKRGNIYLRKVLIHGARKLPTSSSITRDRRSAIGARIEIASMLRLHQRTWSWSPPANKLARIRMGQRCRADVRQTLTDRRQQRAKQEALVPSYHIHETLNLPTRSLYRNSNDERTITTARHLTR